MGLVYRAWDTALERWVAVKVLASERVWSADHQQRFLREARRAAQVSEHPNFATIHAVGRAAGWPYIVMQYVRGQDLASLMVSEGALSAERALTILSQAAAAIDHLHGQHPPIVHRDIKPANFMIKEDDGRVVLTDFGLARRLDDPKLTLEGAVVGTPLYMAPEQCKGNSARMAVDFKADIYSLAVMAYEMLCGRPPFESDNIFELLRKHLVERAPSVRQFRPDLPRAVSVVMGRALAKNPRVRPRSASAFVAQLGGAANARPLPILAGDQPSRWKEDALRKSHALVISARRHLHQLVHTLAGQWAALAKSDRALVTLMIATSIVVAIASWSYYHAPERRLYRAAVAQGRADARANQLIDVWLTSGLTAATLETRLIPALATAAQADVDWRIIGLTATVVADARQQAARARGTPDFVVTPVPVLSVNGAVTVSPEPPTPGPGGRVIVLRDPANGSIVGDCVVRFTWLHLPAASSAAYLGAHTTVGLHVKLCREPDGSSELDCQLFSAGQGGETGVRRLTYSGRYTWQVLTSDAEFQTALSTFDWVPGAACSTATATSTATSTATNTPTKTRTPTRTPTSTPTQTQTPKPTKTARPTASPTAHVIWAVPARISSGKCTTVYWHVRERQRHRVTLNEMQVDPEGMLRDCPTKYKTYKLTHERWDGSLHSWQVSVSVESPTPPPPTP